jgi:hypothetical protein
MSLYRGRGTIAEVTFRVCGREPTRRDGVRYTTAGRLREAGFFPKPKPNAAFPEHVSVYLLDEEREWTHHDGEGFDACFGEPIWWKGDGDG